MTASPAPVSSLDRGSRRNAAILITGAGGEVGHGLIEAIHATGHGSVVAIDIRELGPHLRALCQETYVGDICDASLLERLLAMYEITEIYHLAALLSTRGEFTPETAHAVNVEGTLSLLRLAAEQARSHGQRVKFIFPSSIAVYGMPDLATKQKAGRVREEQFCEPITMYGCNKLYCEELGRYYTRHYKQLSVDVKPHVDFRCVRFPGLISATTQPAGGTSDYASEMIHAAAKGQPYACFVRPDTTIPFMAMPDASDALVTLADTPRARLTRTTYNVGAFSRSAAGIQAMVEAAFPRAEITYKIDEKRQGIVDSWPADVDDAAARADWGFRPAYDFERAFREYLIPTIARHYR